MTNRVVEYELSTAYALGVTLKEYRKQQALTLRDLSSKAHISLSFLSEIERGLKEPSSTVISEIASALDLPMSNLYLDVARKFRTLEIIQQQKRKERVLQ